MSKPRLPESLRRFVERQTTRPVADLWKSDPKEQRSPYGSYWYRAVACILLSGRVQAKHDGTPNMTDVNRVGKEANFNQYLTERIGTFLVASDVIRFDRQGRYEAGPNLAAFWDHDDVAAAGDHTAGRRAPRRAPDRPPLLASQGPRGLGPDRVPVALLRVLPGAGAGRVRGRPGASTTSPGCPRTTWSGRLEGSGWRWTASMSPGGN